MNQVSGSGKEASTCFSSYALILLILFYMMNESKVIPSVEELTILDYKSVAVTGKECEFVMDGNFDGSNNLNILDHVSGFFKYYKISSFPIL